MAVIMMPDEGCKAAHSKCCKASRGYRDLIVRRHPQTAQLRRKATGRLDGEVNRSASKLFKTPRNQEM